MKDKNKTNILYVKKTYFLNKVIRHLSNKTLLYRFKQKPKILHCALYYILFSNSKRMRGHFLCESIFFLYQIKKNFKGKNLLYISIFLIELLHAYSLLHDDLPSMDNDNWRRLKLSCHKCFGVDLAILIGDILLTETMNIATNLEKNVSKIIQEISLASGETGMLLGQILDLRNNISCTSYTICMKILCIKKTATLFVLSALLANISLNGREDILKIAGDMAYYFGIIFQYFDNLIDNNRKDVFSYNKHILSITIWYNLNKTWKNSKKFKNAFGVTSLVNFLIFKYCRDFYVK